MAMRSSVTEREIIQLGPKPKQNLHDFYRVPFSSVASERNPSPRRFRNVHMLAQELDNFNMAAFGCTMKAFLWSLWSGCILQWFSELAPFLTGRRMLRSVSLPYILSIVEKISAGRFSNPSRNNLSLRRTDVPQKIHD